MLTSKRRQRSTEIESVFNHPENHQNDALIHQGNPPAEGVDILDIVSENQTENHQHDPEDKDSDA